MLPKSGFKNGSNHVSFLFLLSFFKQISIINTFNGFPLGNYTKMVLHVLLKTAAGHPWPLFHSLLVLFEQTIQFVTTNECKKMSIQYTVFGYEHTTFRTRVSSLNHQTNAPISDRFYSLPKRPLKNLRKW